MNGRTKKKRICPHRWQVPRKRNETGWIVYGDVLRRMRLFHSLHLYTCTASGQRPASRRSPHCGRRDGSITTPSRFEGSQEHLLATLIERSNFNTPVVCPLTLFMSSLLEWILLYVIQFCWIILCDDWRRMDFVLDADSLISVYVRNRFRTYLFFASHCFRGFIFTVVRSGKTITRSFTYLYVSGDFLKYKTNYICAFQLG